MVFAFMRSAISTAAPIFSTQVLKRIDADLSANPISVGIEVYLGDYIDRGPASREVIDRLVERNRTFRAVFLKGNHETYLTRLCDQSAYPRGLAAVRRSRDADVLWDHAAN